MNEEIEKRINKIPLAMPARIALIQATSDIYEQMKQEDVMQSVSIPHRIATAAFLACDGNACIALPKLKSTFGGSLKGAFIHKARTALNIPHGTARNKVDSLYNVLNIQDSRIKKLAHFYVDVLSGTAHMPSNLAVASIYLASYVIDNRNGLTLKELYRYTGCGEITQREIRKMICQKIGSDTAIRQIHKELLSSLQRSYLLGEVENEDKEI